MITRLCHAKTKEEIEQIEKEIIEHKKQEEELHIHKRTENRSKLYFEYYNYIRKKKDLD